MKIFNGTLLFLSCIFCLVMMFKSTEITEVLKFGFSLIFNVLIFMSIGENK